MGLHESHDVGILEEEKFIARGMPLIASKEEKNKSPCALGILKIFIIFGEWQQRNLYGKKNR